MAPKGKIVKIKGRLYYQTEVAKNVLSLPLFQINPGLSIALFNILGETSLVVQVARALAKKIPSPVEVIVTPEVKSVCLAYELSKCLKVPYVVLRKTFKPYMEGSIRVEVTTITTGKPQQLYLDGKDLKLIKDKRVLVVDDVISTGASLKGMRELIKKAKGKIICEAAVFTEGEEGSWPGIISLGHLPLFKTNGKTS